MPRMRVALTMRASPYCVSCYSTEPVTDSVIMTQQNVLGISDCRSFNISDPKVELCAHK